MAYRENDHKKFFGRVNSFMRLMRNLQREADSLNAIYVNETASGENDYFTSVKGVTKEELQNAVAFLNAQSELITTHISKITPFLD